MNPELANVAQKPALEPHAAVHRCEVVSGAASMVELLAVVPLAESETATGRAAGTAG